MEENAALRTIRSSIDAMGTGFDLNRDTRLLYCKGGGGSRLVGVDQDRTGDLLAFEGLVVPGVPKDVRCSQEVGTPSRRSTGVRTFDEMTEFFNKKALLSGDVPPGSFNSAFSFSGSKKIDAATTRSLAMDGVFIPLCKVQLIKEPLTLQEDVRHAVPISWDPSSLARFIENYGTHVIMSITIGGEDIIYVKQHTSSHLSAVEIKNYVQDVGDQRFSASESHTSSGPIKIKDKAGDPFSFSSQGIYPQPPTAPYLSAKEDITVIFRRRGGDDLVQSHNHWTKTVSSAPDVIEMTFLPIISLLDGIRGKDHLARAISLYLEYKPPIEELRYFLEFQIPRIWAPIREVFPGHERKEPVCPSLQFSIMGQKLYVSQEQVSVGRKLVTGLRLCLEGEKQNRLCIQVLHMESLPKILQPYWDSHIPIGARKWLGPEEQDSRWFKPLRWKNFSHISTAPIEDTESFFGDPASLGACVVTGAQLGVWDFGSKNVLYMKLLYSRIPGCIVRKSWWDHDLSGPTEKSRKPDPASSADANSSSKDAGKLVKLVDTSEMAKGPDDNPGHWLVTGGKLGVEKGKIVLRLKYSLLSY